MFRLQQLKSLFEGRRILIAGYGREGRSSEALIRSLCPGADIAIADGNDNIAAEAARGYDLVLKSPGIPLRVFQRLNDEKPDSKFRMESLTSQADLFLRVFHDRTVGVSGTKGKSTTTSLVHHLLTQGGVHSILAGNIGVPLFDIIPQLDEATWVCAELSCHQLEGITRGPHIGVLLNLFQEHLDHYDDYMGYKMAKLQMGLRQREGDHLYYCRDNRELCELVERLPIASQRHPFGADIATPFDEAIARSLTLPGEHNRVNARVACLVAERVLSEDSKFNPQNSKFEIQNSKFEIQNSKFGIQNSKFGIQNSLQSFRGLRHRLEPVGRYGGIDWVDDSISTIPEAAVAAVEAVGRDRVGSLILGGFDRGIDYSPLVDYLRRHPVPNLVFVGQAGRRIFSLLQNSKFKIRNYLVEDDYPTIVAWCAAHTPQGTVCLLSPAAASYDQFKNFEQRGDRFADLARALARP